jgi:mono/diheme cytochrome c family protein
MAMKGSPVIYGLLALLVTAGGCGTARRSEPIRGPLQLTVEQRAGERVFYRNCNVCHPGGEAGFGPALNNKPLPANAIRYQVRHGIGAMPSFSDSLISGSSLDSLVSYLQAVRKSSPR